MADPGGVRHRRHRHLEHALHGHARLQRRRHARSGTTSASPRPACHRRRGGRHRPVHRRLRHGAPSRSSPAACSPASAWPPCTTPGMAAMRLNGDRQLRPTRSSPRWSSRSSPRPSALWLTLTIRAGGPHRRRADHGRRRQRHALHRHVRHGQVTEDQCGGRPAAACGALLVPIVLFGDRGHRRGARSTRCSTGPPTTGPRANRTIGSPAARRPGAHPAPSAHPATLHPDRRRSRRERPPPVDQVRGSVEPHRLGPVRDRPPARDKFGTVAAGSGQRALAGRRPAAEEPASPTARPVRGAGPGSTGAVGRAVSKRRQGHIRGDPTTGGRDGQVVAGGASLAAGRARSRPSGSSSAARMPARPP